jgi:hypothetical protein
MIHVRGSIYERIATTLWAGRPKNQGFDSRKGQEIFSSYHSAHRPGMGPTQPPVHWVSEPLSSGIRLSRREADHSPPSTVEVNVWRYASAPPYANSDNCNFDLVRKVQCLSVYNGPIYDVCTCIRLLHVDL